AGHPLHHRPHHACDDIGVRVLEHRLRFPRVEPDAVAVRALIDLHALPVAGNQLVTALRAFHEMRFALRGGSLLLQRGALLPQQLRVAPREVFVFVAADVAHGVVTRLRPGGSARGEDDWPLYPCPFQRNTASTTWLFWRITRSSVPQVCSQPLGYRR